MSLDQSAVILISGHVQGVGYRYAASRMAESLGLTGFVKNKPNGSVYIEVQGSSDLINTFVGWCKTGPAHAFVESVELSYQSMKDFNGFIICH
jgi:acylphosphatase